MISTPSELGPELIIISHLDYSEVKTEAVHLPSQVLQALGTQPQICISWCRETISFTLAPS